MSEGTVRQCCRMFKVGGTNVQDEERSDRPSVVSDDLVQNIRGKNCERWRLKLQNFRVNFHKFHALFCMILSQLG
jgi:transposase